MGKLIPTVTMTEFTFLIQSMRWPWDMVEWVVVGYAGIGITCVYQPLDQ